MNDKLKEAYEKLAQEYPDLAPENAEISGLRENGNDIGLNAYSPRTCETCIKFKLNIHDCCKANPQTGEQTAEGYCPNLDLDSGLCSVYNTPEYPDECRDFSCVYRIFD